MSKNTKRNRIVTVALCVVLLFALCWASFFAQVGSSRMHKFIEYSLNKVAPAPGDINILSYGITGDTLKLKLSGTVIDDGDAIVAPYAAAEQLMKDVFHRTKITNISIQWNDYLILSYSKDAFSEYQKLQEGGPFSNSGAFQSNIIQFFAKADSYAWIDKATWAKATALRGWITAKELPESKGLKGGF